MDFSAIEQRYGLPPGYLSRVRTIESSDGRNTYNRLSGAAGDFQFIPRTARAYGLTNPYDTMAAADAAARLAADNRAALMRAGIDNPTAAQLYLAHQQGAKGAASLLNAQGPAGDIVGRDAVAWNSGDPSQSGSSFAQRVMSLYDRGAPATFEDRFSAIAQPPASPPQQPATAYSSDDRMGLLATIGGLLGDSGRQRQQQQIAPLQPAPMQRRRYVPFPEIVR